jgi:hypothetical protein
MTDTPINERALIDRLLSFTSHSLACAIYQRSWASGAPKCTCGLDEVRASVAALTTAGQANGEQCPVCGVQQHDPDCPYHPVYDLATPPQPQSPEPGAGEDGEPSAWAIQAERDAMDVYAQHMGDPEGNDDINTARMAAARVIEAAALAFLRAPSTDLQTSDGDMETWETINQWCDDTFGAATVPQIIERAKEEWAELEEEGSDKAIEAADVVICLCRIPGFADALQRKMAINRKRKWRLVGNGTGYHIPDAAAPQAQNEVKP